jgi:hypothetical protein
VPSLLAEVVGATSSEDQHPSNFISVTLLSLQAYFGATRELKSA